MRCVRAVRASKRYRACAASLRPARVDQQQGVVLLTHSTLLYSPPMFMFFAFLMSIHLFSSVVFDLLLLIVYFLKAGLLIMASLKQVVEVASDEDEDDFGQQFLDIFKSITRPGNCSFGSKVSTR